jgi:hypothetical protein
MQYTIELLNDNTLNLLHDLERLNLLRFIKKETKKEVVTPVIVPPKKRFAGRISKATAADLQKQLKQSREEWQY